MNKDFCTLACSIPHDMITHRVMLTHSGTHTNTLKVFWVLFYSVQYHNIFRWGIQERGWDWKLLSIVILTNRCSEIDCASVFVVSWRNIKILVLWKEDDWKIYFSFSLLRHSWDRKEEEKIGDGRQHTNTQFSTIWHHKQMYAHLHCSIVLLSRTHGSVCINEPFKTFKISSSFGCSLQ